MDFYVFSEELLEVHQSAPVRREGEEGAGG
jgi:hypothetical protein